MPLLSGGISLLLASPFAWGAAAHVQVPSWMTSFVGVAFALPAIAIGLLTMHRIIAATRAEYQLMKLHLPPGLILLLLGAAALNLASRIGQEETYNSLRDANGRISTTPDAFLAVSLLTLAFATLLAACCAYMYGQAVLPVRRTKFDRRDDEPDPLGQMLNQR